MVSSIVRRPEAGRQALGVRGFSLVEVTVALFITAEVILAGLALFDFHNRLARVQTQITDMQQSMRVAQYELVRLTRMAGRGGFPAVVKGNWGAVSVRNNVGTSGVSDQVAISYSNTPLAVDGTDILQVTGVFSSTVYEAQPTLALLPAGSTPATATSGSFVICAYQGGIAQNLTPLINLINSEKAAGQTDALILVSPRSDSVYAVVELLPGTSVVTGNQPTCSAAPAWVTTAPNPNGIQVAFKITGDTLANAFQALSNTASAAGLPSAMSAVLWVGVLEQYRYYVRQDYVVPGNNASTPAPHLSRARMYPGTELPYQNNLANLTADVADNVLDLQVALGVDLNGDGVITEGNPPGSTTPSTTDEWLGNVANDVLTPQSPLREVRITTLTKTANPDPAFQGPLIGNIEDHVYTSTMFPNTPTGRLYRNRLLQTVVGLRNL